MKYIERNEELEFEEDDDDIFYYDRTCEYCTSFAKDQNDYNYGVCLNGEIFEPYIEDCLACDFSKCYDLYLEKRYDGTTKVCDDFELPEFISNEEFEAYEEIEQKRTINVDALIACLYTDDYPIDVVLSNIYYYVYFRNQGAYKGLRDYYIGLGAADNLDEVHRRVGLIEVLHTIGSEEDNIEAFINELKRTPSNNTTRQLYTKILDYLNRYTEEKVREPLLNLLDVQNYGKKLTEKIYDIAFRYNMRDFF